MVDISSRIRSVVTSAIPLSLRLLTDDLLLGIPAMKVESRISRLT
jgi:hypothetical protein